MPLTGITFAPGPAVQPAVELQVQDDVVVVGAAVVDAPLCASDGHDCASTDQSNLLYVRHS